MSRPDWNQYFMGIAFMTAKRSSCKEINSGAILVKDRNLLATGYNGSPAGTVHCLEKGCLKKHLLDEGKEVSCRGINAEMNAILQAAKHGISVDGSILYVSFAPNYDAAKMLINAGIKEVVYMDGSMCPSAAEVLKEAGIIAERYIINDAYKREF